MKNKNWSINRSAMIFSKKSKRLNEIKKDLKTLIPLKYFQILL